MARARALVITGYGLNCEAETSHALRLAGADVHQVHLSDLIAGKKRLEDYQLLALIGGFAFGDHISAGKVFANRLKSRLRDPLETFIAGKGLVIGICNGFQTLAKLGLLPGLGGDYGTQVTTLATNDSGVFRNAWIRLKGNAKSPCVFSKGIETLEVPIRHGEGKFCLKDEDVLRRLESDGQIVFRYASPETGAVSYTHLRAHET